MDQKIREVNKKLLRTFERLNYKINYDETADEIIVLNSLVAHVYRLFVQKELQSASNLPSKIQHEIQKESETFKASNDHHEEIINQCCDKVAELAQLFLMLLKILNKGNEINLRKCLSEIQILIEELQETLLGYEPKQKNTKSRMQQLKNVSLKTSINITEIPQKLIKSSEKSIGTASTNGFKIKKKPIQKINSSADLIEDLKEEVQSLNHALAEHSSEYGFRFQNYTEKLAFLEESMNRMQVETFHMQKNQRNYLNEINQLKNQKLEDDILIKSLVRKLRKFEELSTVESKFTDFSSRNGGNPYRNYMCPKLSREKMIGISQGSRSGSRPVSIENQNKVRSKKKWRVQTLY